MAKDLKPGHNKASNDPYRDAGVDIAAGEHLVEWLAQAEPTKSMRGESIGGIGGFAGLFRPNFSGLEDPCLVACTDGVGTKLLLALESKQLSGLGQDLVAMCLNDLYCVGAEPLFFLDYFATGKLDKLQFQTILSGIQTSLAAAQCSLLGGETAEMPGLYSQSHFDLAGFSVGVVDRTKQLGPNRVRPGQKLVAFPSTGFHANGFSLIRKWLTENSKLRADQELLSNLLQPTALYTQIPKLAKKFGSRLAAVAHITGGGISGNLVRILPPGLSARITESSIPTPQWMRQFITANGASFQDVETVFNWGCGMIAAVDESIALDFIAEASNDGEPLVEIGAISESNNSSESHVYYE